MSDVEFLLFLRLRVSNKSTELARVRDFLDQERTVPLTLTAARKYIVRECQRNIVTVDELPEPRLVQPSLTASAAAATPASMEAASEAFWKAEYAPEANRYHAAAAVGIAKEDC